MHTVTHSQERNLFVSLFILFFLNWQKNRLSGREKIPLILTEVLQEAPVHRMFLSATMKMFSHLLAREIIYVKKMLLLLIPLKSVGLCLLSVWQLFDQVLVLFIHLEYLYEHFSKIFSIVCSILRVFSHYYRRASRCTGASGFRN